MTYNLLIGGAAGQGLDTAAAILEKILKRSGLFVYTTRDFMSRVRGGHNFIQVRFGPEAITSHSNRLDGLIAFDQESIDTHLSQVGDEGFVLCDTALSSGDGRIIRIDMQAIAKQLGNPRVIGSVATGALLGLFGLDLELAEAVLKGFLKAELIDINVKALEAGRDAVKPRFDLPSAKFQDHMIISGNQAIALGALSAGLRFYSAYPMSPSTSIMEYLAAQGDTCGVVVEQAEDEIAAINMVLGASFAGARAMTATSGGGFSLMVEALGFSGMAEIPAVIANIQRPGPATGLPTRTEQSDLKFVISAAQGEFPRMVIALRNHADAFSQTIRAFDIADRYRIPVILLSDQYLADASTTVPMFSIEEADGSSAGKADEITAGQEFLSYRLTDSGISPRLFPGNPDHLVAADSDEHDEAGRITESAEVRRQMMDKRLGKLEKLKQELQEPLLVGKKTFKYLLVGWGSMHGPLSEAVSILNQGQAGYCSALVFGDIFPMPVKTLQTLAKKAERVINVEQNATGQLAGLMREYAGISCRHSILKYDGRQLTGEEIADQIKEVVKNEKTK